jgi:hypothetical protein
LKELTLLNYQQRFSALIKYERDAHCQELMRKSVAYHVDCIGSVLNVTQVYKINIIINAGVMDSTGLWLTTRLSH